MSRSVGTVPMPFPLALFSLNFLIKHMVTLYEKDFLVVIPSYIIGLLTVVNGNLFSSFLIFYFFF